MVGFGMDELHQGDGLTLAELHQALDDSVFGKQMTLEWIGFDACLMSTAEVAFIVAGYARYMIASQETLPNEGMNYLFLKDASASSLTGPEVAETIINRTFEYYDQKARNQPDRAFDLTLSCLDLAKLPALENTINELFEDMEGMLEDGKYNALAQQRSDVKAFGLSNTDQSFDLIDLVDLAQIMSLIYPERCEALVAAIQDMIVMNRTNQEDASGISIYYPYRNKNHYSKQWQKAYANLGFAAKYTNYMSRFGSILLADSLASWSGSKALIPDYDEQRQQYSLQLSSEQAESFDRAYYYLLLRYEGEVYFMQHQSSDVTLDDQLRLTANFDDKWVLVKGGPDSLVGMPVITERERKGAVSHYHSRVILRRGERYEESAVGSLLVTADKQAGTAGLRGLILDHGDTESMMGKRDAELADWSLIEFWSEGRFLTRDPQGNMLPFSSWKKAGAYRGWNYRIAEGLQIYYGEVDEVGVEMYCLIEIIDTQGNAYTSDLMKISQTSNVQEAVLPYQDWSPKVIVNTADPSTSRLLVDESGIRVEMEGFGFEDNKLAMRLNIQNTLDEELRFHLKYPVYNDEISSSIGSTVYLSIPANSADSHVWEFGSAEGIESMTLDHINKVDCILFIQSDEDYRTIIDDLPISLLTDLPLPDHGPSVLSLIPQQSFTQDGLRFMTKQVSKHEDGIMEIGCIMGNEANIWDVLRFVDIKVNGVGDFYENVRYLNPGSSLETGIWIYPRDADAEAAMMKAQEAEYFIQLYRAFDPDDAPLRRIGPFKILIREAGAEAILPVSIEVEELSALPEKTVIQLHFRDGVAEPVTLMDREGIKLVWKGLGYTDNDQVVSLILQGSISTGEDLYLVPVCLSVNQQPMYFMGDATKLNQPGGEAPLMIPLLGRQSLAELGMDKVSSLDFGLAVSNAQEEVVIPPFHVSMLSDLQLPPPQHPDGKQLSLVPGIILDQDDVRLEVLGAWQDKQALKIKFIITNTGNSWDYFSMGDVSVNGFASNISSLFYVRPGTKRFETLRIYNSKLEDFGITNIHEVAFFPSLSRRGVPESQYQQKLGSKRFEFTEQQETQVIAEGRTLVDSDGILVVQLDSDPSGQSFFVKNETSIKVSLRFFDELLREQDLGYVFLEQSAFAPGLQGYTKIWSIVTQSGTPASGQDPVSLQLQVVNQDFLSLMVESEVFQVYPDK